MAAINRLIALGWNSGAALSTSALKCPQLISRKRLPSAAGEVALAFDFSEVRPQELAARLDLMRIYVGHLVGHLERMELKPSSRQSCGSGLLG